jgi:hypothetical protein
MREQFDMSNSRRGSSPPFQEFTEVPSQSSTQGPTVSDAAKKSSNVPTETGRALDGETPAGVRFD